MSSKTPILPLLALKHKLDQDVSKVKIEPSSFDMKIYNERAKRKNNPNHPLFAKKKKDCEDQMPGDQFQDITSIINDRYPMPKRTRQDPRNTMMDDMYNMSNFELDLLGYHALENGISKPSSYRTYENKLMFAHGKRDDEEPELPFAIDKIKAESINHLTGQQPSIVEPFDRFSKLPAHVLANSISPQLKMKDHMVSFKTIEPQEMIKTSWRARGSISKAKENK